MQQLYWLVDLRPRQPRADFLRLTDGRFQPAPLDSAGRAHPLVLPGFWLRPDWVWLDPLPNPLDGLVDLAPDVLHRSSGDGVH